MMRSLLFLKIILGFGILLAAGYAQTAPAAPDRLTLPQAEAIALTHNPQVSVSKLLALAEGQVTREVRSRELPNLTGNLTAVDPEAGTRVTAGGLNNPVLYQRAAGGVSLSQLITDFGRSRNLVSAEKNREKARQEDAIATAADITLAVDQAFYRALEAQSLLSVARQTVSARQLTVDQVQALTNAKPKSDLDLSFANVNLAQAKLLELNAANQLDEAMANLNTLLGQEKQQPYQLVEEPNPQALALPPQDLNQLTADAFRSRPDLAAFNDQWQAAEKFRNAEHDLYRPTISALAVGGGAPVRDRHLSPDYGAAGVNISIPIFNGFEFSARAREADYRAQAASEQVRDLRNRIARDVCVSWLQANTSFQRVNVAGQLLQQANLALDLAQSRYQLGLGSIVELSQAQLQQTEAAIGSANAQYDYQIALSTLKFQTGH